MVSDVHGRADALARAGDGADALICLGDLILFLDYHDHGQGIFADLFGADNTAELVRLRSARRFDDARRFSQRMWSRVDGDRATVLEDAVRRQYARLFAALPTPSYITYGNVDLPHLFDAYLRDGVHLLDGATVDLGGRTFGFIGGGLRTPMRTPYEVSDEEYAAKVAAVGAVDVLCAHIPPHLPELTYDVEGRRFERGSRALLEAVLDTQPSYLLFGHVHQPLRQSLTIGRTRCVNVGHFRARGRPFVLEW